MKATAVLLTVAVAVALQLALARYTVGGRWLFDLVLVGVVFAGLNWGPVAGMLAGTTGGLIQDVLSDDIVGTGGLAKTLTGFASGFVGSQLVVARPAARAGVVAAASVVHRLLILGLRSLIEQHWSGVPWTAILVEMALNAVCGLVAFVASDRLPGVVARGRQNRRSGISRREW